MSFRLLSSFFLLSFSLFGAVDGAIRIIAKTTDSNNFEYVRAWYAPGQVPSTQWTRPFIDGTGATTWQAHNLTFYEANWCTAKANQWLTGATLRSAFVTLCTGSVQSAFVAFNYSSTADTTYTITFRNSATPCSGGADVAACTAAGLDLTEALAVNGGSWDFLMKYAAAGGVTHSQSVRAMLTDGNACIVYAGPAMTIIDAGWASGSGYNCQPVTTRPYAFGIHAKRVLTNSANISSANTTIAIHENPWITSASFPVDAVIRGSFGDSTTVTITSATSTQLTLSGAVGANYNYNVSIYVKSDHITTNTANTGMSSVTLDVVSAAGFTAGDIACVRDYCFRIHSKSSNILTIGTTTLNANKVGWGWYGIHGRASDGLATGMPIWKYSDVDYYLASATAQKNLTPRAVLMFVTGRNYPGAHLITSSRWYDRMSGAHFDHSIEIGVGGGTVAATRDKVTVSASAMVMYPDGPDQFRTDTYISRGFVWAGSTPGDAIVDYNLAWLRSVGAFPLDPTVQANAGTLSAHLTENEMMGDGQPLPGWDNSSKCSIGMGYWGSSWEKTEFVGRWYLDEGQGGSTDNIGELSSQQAHSLLLMDKTGISGYERWREMLFGGATCGFMQNVHTVSAVNSGTWCGSANNGTTNEPGASCTGGNATVTPFGRPMIPDSTPAYGFTAQTDVTPRVGQLYNLFTYNYSYGSSHYYNMCDAAYTLTGLPSWEICFEGNVFGALALSYASNRPFNAGLTSQNERNEIGWSEKGIARPASGPRGRARSIMMIGSGAAKFPAGSARKEVALSKYKNNVAFWEGRTDLRTGNFYSSNTSSYDHSLWRGGWWSSGASAVQAGIPVINGNHENCSIAVGGDNVNPSTETVNSRRAWNSQGMFMFAYFPVTLRWHEQLGLYHGIPLQRHYLRTPVNLLLNPTAHSGTGIRFFGAYAWPEGTKNPQGSDVSICTGQPNQNTLGTVFQMTGSNMWLHYVQAMHSNGLSPTAARTYPNLTRDRDWLWLASMGVLGTVDGYSPRHAWNSLRGDLSLASTSAALTQYGKMPNMLWSPDWKHEPMTIAITPGTTTATVTFIAPENATSCGYTVSSSAITDPSDAGDTSASVGRREVTYSLTSLSSATQYNFRLTCKDSTEKYIGRRHTVFTTN